MTKQLYKLFCVLLLAISMPAMAASQQFAMIVDAGSTGTRLYLFAYQKSSSSAVPIITENYFASVQPGLSAYEKNPAAAGSSMKPMLDGALKKLQALGQDPKVVPISIFGTGGMRLLVSEKQNLIYANIRTYLAQQYPFSIAEIKTISGQTEGVYGWLDVNYLMGSLEARKTYGNIDIGGASTQIAFEVQEMNDPVNQVVLTLNGQKRIIYSKSFIGLGLEESRKALNQDQAAINCYPHHYQVQEVGVGQFNFGRCEKAYDGLLEKHQVKQQVRHAPQQLFIAYSGAYRTLSFFGMRDKINFGAIEENLQSICGRSWEELQSMYPKIQEKELATYCANGVYVGNLFYHGYQLQDAEVISAVQINERNINWPLGALLYSLLGN